MSNNAYFLSLGVWKSLNSARCVTLYSSHIYADPLFLSDQMKITLVSQRSRGLTTPLERFPRSLSSSATNSWMMQFLLLLPVVAAFDETAETNLISGVREHKNFNQFFLFCRMSWWLSPSPWWTRTTSWTSTAFTTSRSRWVNSNILYIPLSWAMTLIT